ncbi:MAG: hypothetical protein HQK63_07840 [Desulfamplus sp.]|nr:hypothetical protein [Desulfamplus sp.]
MSQIKRRTIPIIALCLIMLVCFTVNTQITNADQITEGQDTPSACKFLPASISVIDALSDVSKAPVAFSSSTFTLNFPAYCEPVDIYFAVATPYNKLIFTDSNGKLKLDYLPYISGSKSAVNTSFSVADSALASDITGKCVLYWFVAPENGGNILKSIESGRYELGWYNTDTTVMLPTSSSRVPDTGITKCYDDSKEIPCPEERESFYGQDGNYSINPISYTKLDDNGNDLPITAASWAIVKDNVTGLIWENKSHYSTWYDAPDVIADINSAKLGRYSESGLAG